LKYHQHRLPSDNLPSASSNTENKLHLLIELQPRSIFPKYWIVYNSQQCIIDTQLLRTVMHRRNSSPMRFNEHGVWEHEHNHNHNHNSTEVTIAAILIPTAIPIATSIAIVTLRIRRCRTPTKTITATATATPTVEATTTTNTTNAATTLGACLYKHFWYGGFCRVSF